jgi:hypothetical protein
VKRVGRKTLFRLERKEGEGYKIVDIMDDYISDLAEINQSSEYLVKTSVIFLK